MNDVQSSQKAMAQSDIFAFCAYSFKRIPKLFWYVLLSTVVFGLAAHMYVFTHLLPVHDASRIVTDYLALDIATGRIGDIFIRYLHGFISVPWLIGLISIAAYAFASYFVCLTLRIKRIATAVTVSALMVTFPVVSQFNSFIFSADVFAIHVMLSCLAVYLASRSKYGFIIGTVVLFISLTVYQASLSIAASLSLVVLILSLVEKDASVKQVFFCALRLLLMLAFATAVYYVFWKLSMQLFHVAPVSYSGMDHVGHFESLELVLKLVVLTYKETARFFLLNRFSFYPLYVSIALIVGLMITLFQYLRMLGQCPPKKGLALRIGLLVVFILLLPIAMTSMKIMSGGADTHFLQKYSYITPWLFMIAVWERHLECVPIKKRVMSFIMSCVVMLSCVFSVYNGIYGANASYINLQLKYNSALSIVTNVVNRIKSTKGYTPDTPVIVVGMETGGRHPGFDWCDDAAVASAGSAITYENVMYDFIRNMDPNVIIIRGAEYAGREDVVALPEFPDPDCTMWIGDQLLIKLS